MPRKSAGLLLYRYRDQQLQLFLVHPGGPYFANKDTGAWSVPKGEYDDNEDALAAAKREFEEETGRAIDGNFITLQPIKQKGGKIVTAWAIEGDIDEKSIVSNTFKMEYPYRSGKWMEVPEIDQAAWLNVDDAIQKINPAQVSFIHELQNILTL